MKRKEMIVSSEQVLILVSSFAALVCIAIDLINKTPIATIAYCLTVGAVNIIAFGVDFSRRRKWARTCGWCLGDLRRTNEVHCSPFGVCHHPEGHGCAPLHSHGFPGSQECPPPSAVGLGVDGGWCEVGVLQRRLSPDEIAKVLSKMPISELRELLNQIQNDPALSSKIQEAAMP